MGKVTFNILNFTKERSLYQYGMKICFCRVSDKIQQIKQFDTEKLSFLDTDSFGWQKGGNDIKYGHSSLNHLIRKACEPDSSED